MFETYQDKAGKWRWRFRDDNKLILFASSQGYSRFEDMMTCLDRARGSKSSTIKRAQ